MWSALSVVAMASMFFGHFSGLLAMIAAVFLAFRRWAFALRVRAFCSIFAHDLLLLMNQKFAPVYIVR
jgi:nitrate reductase gamma subunit